MPYVVIEDFKSGLDRRKLSAASPQGSLQTLSNAHITRGGEIEKRLAFVSKYSLPSGTFGLAGANGQLYVFSSSAPTMPTGVTCQQLAHPTGVAMAGLTAAEFFNGQVFASASYTDNSNYCFYNGTRVTDWDPASGTTVSGQKATALLTVKNKVYASATSVVNFSAVATPTAWAAGSGYGFVNMSNQSAGSESLTGLGRYQNYLAVFARRNTQIWYVDPDPLQNVQRQVIQNIGTFAPKSIINFGEIDVIFLSDTGIRSLKARDASNQAGVSDIGTPIDDEVIAYMRTLSDTVKFASAAVLDPIDGRYIVAMGTRNYVFSYYPASRISSWSRYDPGIQITDWVSMDGRIYARAGDTIYLLGGDDGQTYDATAVEIELPYIDGRSIATWKSWTGFDIVSQGEWKVYINTDPDQPNTWVQIGTIADGTNATIAGMDIDMVSDSPVIKVRLVNSRAGPAKISKVIAHYRAQAGH
ncbi:hypothetical protein UFOVP4_7 [uncultured Caudovirales phage]|uniref:Uncharacterized protein n=1 Tax=uncultured Caudovirales phage TaxID=2100421 RepID=A0A6J5KID0_9CAUD|nr:hypothetical protein UFOVP4_7 [uncultured Caudovirales phage]CAB4241348.1 hypothetical protein UFOVP64_52 [uncultured Caudovirales phage]CAB5078967.1 hypothetical protein UFOVP145_8 [uncultured Caudovirales phage]